MGRKCAVPGCLSEEGREEDLGVTFHKIPLHSDIRPKWMSLCHIPEDKQFIKVVHVCSRHFLKADFCQFKGRKYMLRQGVLPTVFPWSKLKKELTDDGTTTSNIKVEESPKEDNLEQIVNNESVKMKVDIKTETNDEPTDFVLEETINSKEEGAAKEDTIILSNASDGDGVKNKKPVEQSSTIIEQKGKAIQTASGVLNFVINERLEALDVKQMWFPARIIEIDYEDNEVLIHFEKYSSKFDEWISMDSCRLRPIQPPSKKQMLNDVFVVSEKCMASWSDARKFPATIAKVIDKDTYEVLFDDGVVKVLKSHRIAKADAKVIGSAPLFKPVEGTKQDRRDKKRKLNVAKLFHKRVRYDTDEGVSNVMAEERIASPIEEAEGVGLGVYPRWENGRPVGTESAIETNDGLRKSIVVVDPRLPPNWLKHLSQRTHGVSAGKWDTFITNPEGRKFRIRSEVKTYIEENPHLNLNEAMFDFALHRKPRAAPRRSLPPVEPVLPPEPMAIDEEVEAHPSLKFEMVGDVYACPIEGCGKFFRRTNLAQMHVKHYHPEFIKYLDPTPNVADLAYARTVGESLDKSPERNIKSTPARQPQKCVTPKVVVPKTVVSPPSLEVNITATQQQSIDSQASQLQKTKDSEILKLLNSKPIDDNITLKYPPGLPPNMYPDIKLKDLLNKSEGIPKREDLNLKNLSTTRPTGIKTLLPVVRTTEPKKDGDIEKNPSLDKKNCSKLKRQLMENVESIMKPKEVVESTSVATNLPILSETNSNYIVEGGEVIKIVQMKSEEIINCTCGITEEDGLMIQCEVCLCWQHAYCNNIERENQVPDNYICYICQNPVRQRSSKKYYHDQDWLKNGTLPVASYHCKDEEAHKKRFEDLKLSHDLSGRLIELKDFMHSLKVKMKIADVKNHPKLYLWSKPWDKLPLPEKQDVKETEETKPKCNLTENEFSKSDIDLLSNKTEVQNESMLLSLLKSTKDEQKLKDEMDINNLLANNLEQLPIAGPIIPQPEAAIDSGDCKINLLEHIAHSQTLVEERLNNLENQIDKLDADDNNSEQDYARTCVTIQMLLKDLNTLKELSHNNNL